jgi:threonine/homoserine/homoserine lactone efflux protein
MIESVITLTIIGFAAGFIFSIPVAGPINIIITTNALEGKFRFCIRTALGASIMEFFYVLIVVYGITALYLLYQPIIPYLLLAGSIILIFVGIKIIKTKLSANDLTSKSILKDKIKNKGGFRTGIIINITNPSLFLGWLISTFIVFSFASSVGLNTGGLDLIVNKNVESLKEMAGEEFNRLEDISVDKDKVEELINDTVNLPPLLLAVLYAFAVTIGSFTWLYVYTSLIVKYRQKFNLNILLKIIQALGVCLILISLYLAYRAFDLLLA